MTDVSIIIVSWNTKDKLNDCLKSIYRQASKLTYEVIVADNASSDGSAEMVKREFSEVILLQNNENRGFAAANNIGMAVAQGRYILLLNSDTIVLDDAIGQVVSFADLHPESAVVGCKVLNPDGTLQRTCFMFPSLLNMLLSSTYLYKLFPWSKFFGREQMTWWDRNDVREVDVVTGCFMLVRREAINQVGLIDERFFMYGEETDWCYRFKQTGWKIVFAPVGEIIHLGGASSSKMAARMTLQLRGAILQFMAKHYSKATYILSCILTGAFFSLRVPFWLIKAIVSSRNRLSCWNKVKVYSKGVLSLLYGYKGLLVKADK
jgi:GT2 family glycosyltransferase